MSEPLDLEAIEALIDPDGCEPGWQDRNALAKAAPALLSEVKRLRTENATYERFADDLNQTREAADRAYNDHADAMQALFIRYQRRCAELDAEKAKVADLLAGKWLPTYEALESRIAELELAVSTTADDETKRRLIASRVAHIEVTRLKKEVAAAVGPFGGAFDLMAPSAAVHVLTKLAEAEREVKRLRALVPSQFHTSSQPASEWRPFVNGRDETMSVVLPLPSIALSSLFVWTTDRPEAPDSPKWYWHRRHANALPFPVNIATVGGRLFAYIDGEEHEVSSLPASFEWAGPIRLPSARRT
jgi:hypothetical protein